MAQHKPVRIRGFEESALLSEEREPQDHIHFHEGVPRENATNTDRLAERSLLQGAQSGLLHDRVAVDGVEEEF